MKFFVECCLSSHMHESQITRMKLHKLHSAQDRHERRRLSTS
jgi:hypothetical protein